ncbi:MAG: lipopolysaccharide transport periplasmic protein LptA [Burkholderiaceae bacterium]|nr:lipopolysaccharide transport periplasmic protein LptA [Burkholderiaceae bacterium]
MKHRLVFILHAALLPALIATAPALAEKADSEKEIHVESNQVAVDNVKQISTYTGNVVLTQGTLVMKGTRLVVTTSPEGYDFATLYAPPGGLATMRQKRDGGPDLWMEGEASDRVTYDQKTSIATLYSNAKVRRLTGPKTTDESTGAFLSYNGQTEVVTGANSESGESKPGGGRVSVVIQPHNHAAPKDTKDSTTEAKDKAE